MTGATIVHKAVHISHRENMLRKTWYRRPRDEDLPIRYIVIPHQRFSRHRRLAECIRAFSGRRTP